MLINCGPIIDRRIFKLELPFLPQTVRNAPYLKKFFFTSNKLNNNDTIGILVSGGVDSVLLYYLLLKENFDTGNQFKITPYTILRKDGSSHYAKTAINYIHQKFKLPSINLNVIGNVAITEDRQVESGIMDILHKKEEYVYVGLIEARDEHLIDWPKHKFVETFHRRYPLLNLQKSHVVDLYIQHNLIDLLKLTYSCVDKDGPCGVCNGCRERIWGLTQMGLDPSL